VLWLYFAGRRGGPQTHDKVIDAYPVNRPWIEGERQSDPVTGTDGLPASGGEVTWNSAGAAPWSAPGCGSAPDDRDATPVASLSIAPSEPAGHWVSLDVTQAVRRWVAQPQANNGLLLRETDESGQFPGVLQFFSSEAFKCQSDGFGGGKRIAWRPTLVVFPVQGR
jgi:hypothetical protein